MGMGMEIGIGFLVGAFAGTATAAIIAVVIAASRRAVKASAPPDKTATAARPAPAPRRATARTERKPTSVGQTSTPTRRTGHTLVVGKVEERDQQLHKNIHEVRELLLGLANVISSTESASGKAAKAFTSARDAIDRIASDESDALGEAQRILVTEIDRVLRSNAELHTELDKANQGIVEQRRQIEELRVQARIDGLTRINNRAAFDERLSEYISLFDRTQLGFALLLLDIDFFKRVNDEYGHLNGDRILRGVASKISVGIRNNDFAARYGGEEFAVIFPAADAADAFLVADRMRQDIARTNFRLDDKVIKVTVSGGIAQCETGMTEEQVVSAADAALYDAKNGGRNRVIVAGAGDAAKKP